MTYSFIRRSLPLMALALVLTGGAAQAQAGFDDGSFEATATPAPEPTGGDFGGGFEEGSFDPGAAAPEPQPPAPPKPPAAAQPGVTPGGGDFEGGSFDPGGDNPSAEGDDPPPSPNPPAPNPPAPNPAPPTWQAATIPPEIAEFEFRDFGVPPTEHLRSGAFHAPTPTAIPGAQLVGTEALVQAMNGGMRLVLIDALGGQYSLPGALMAPGLAEGGNFQDRVQQQAQTWLGQITGGDSTLPVVVYCSDPHCWMSYNATLRVVAAGYSNVYWYRGGLQAWQMAGLQLQPSGF